MRVFHKSMHTRRRDLPVSILPVGETSRSQCSRSAGDRPLRALVCVNDGEGQALALR